MVQYYTHKVKQKRWKSLNLSTKSTKWIHKKALPFIFWIFIQHYTILCVYCLKLNAVSKIHSFLSIVLKLTHYFLCFDKISDFCCSTLFLLIQKVRSGKKNLIILLLYLLIYLFSCMVSRVHCFMWFSYPVFFSFSLTCKTI